eukprot:302294_1
MSDVSQSDEETIFVRVYINKQYELTHDIDANKDIWKLAELNSNPIDLESLKQDIPDAFRNVKLLKPLFQNTTLYRLHIYGYDTTKAEIEIDNDEDLQDEIDSFITSDNDTDDDVFNQNKYLKVRVVFEKLCIDPNTTNEIKIDDETSDTNIYHFIAPKLYLKRIRHYFHKQTKQMAISVELEWIISQTTLDTYPSSMFAFYIRENLRYCQHEYVSETFGQTNQVLAPLDVSTKYEFQIKMFDKLQPLLHKSQWSKPFIVLTPSPPNNTPTPKYLQITTLLPHLVEIKWDPGFAPPQQQEIIYIVKEYLQFATHPFVAKYPIPTGKLSPLKPNTQYQISIYTSYNNIDSPDSKSIQFITPLNNFNEIEKYIQPSPPINIQQSIDDEYNEIILMWNLPPNTFGTNIHYKILDLPQQNDAEYEVYELPCRMPRALQNVKIRIITVTELNDREYLSKPIQIILNGNNSIPKTIPEEPNDLLLELINDGFTMDEAMKAINMSVDHTINQTKGHIYEYETNPLSQQNLLRMYELNPAYEPSAPLLDAETDNDNKNEEYFYTQNDETEKKKYPLYNEQGIDDENKDVKNINEDNQVNSSQNESIAQLLKRIKTYYSTERIQKNNQIKAEKMKSNDSKNEYVSSSDTESEKDIDEHSDSSHNSHKPPLQTMQSIYQGTNVSKLECDGKSISNCLVIHRIINALKCYHDVETNDFISFIINEYALCLDDYIHLIYKHSNTLDEISNSLATEHGFVKCDLNKCKWTQRHYNNRRRSNFPSNFQESNDFSDDEQYNFYIKLFDTIHFYLFHLEDLGLRLNLNHKEIEITECFDDKEDQYLHFIDKTMGFMQNEIERKRQKYAIHFNRLNNNSKFIIQQIGSSITQNESSYKHHDIDEQIQGHENCFIDLMLIFIENKIYQFIKSPKSKAKIIQPKKQNITVHKENESIFGFIRNLFRYNKNENLNNVSKNNSEKTEQATNINVGSNEMLNKLKVFLVDEEYDTDGIKNDIDIYDDGGKGNLLEA